jgi:hypothetical protein
VNRPTRRPTRTYPVGVVGPARRSLSVRAGTAMAASAAPWMTLRFELPVAPWARLTPSGHERGMPLLHEWDLVDGLLVVLDGVVQWQVVEIE